MSNWAQLAIDVVFMVIALASGTAIAYKILGDDYDRPGVNHYDIALASTLVIYGVLCGIGLWSGVLTWGGWQ